MTLTTEIWNSGNWSAKDQQLLPWSSDCLQAGGEPESQKPAGPLTADVRPRKKGSGARD